MRGKGGGVLAKRIGHTFLGVGGRRERIEVMMVIRTCKRKKDKAIKAKFHTVQQSLLMFHSIIKQSAK